MKVKLVAYNKKNNQNYSFDAINYIYLDSQNSYNEDGLTPDEEEELPKVYPEFLEPLKVEWNHKSFRKKLAYAINEALKS